MLHHIEITVMPPPAANLMTPHGGILAVAVGGSMMVIMFGVIAWYCVMGCIARRREIV